MNYNFPILMIILANLQIMQDKDYFALFSTVIALVSIVTLVRIDYLRHKIDEKLRQRLQELEDELKEEDLKRVFKRDV